MIPAPADQRAHGNTTEVDEEERPEHIDGPVQKNAGEPVVDDFVPQGNEARQE
jgi:hypothetical protein